MRSHSNCETVMIFRHLGRMRGHDQPAVDASQRLIGRLVARSLLFEEDDVVQRQHQRSAAPYGRRVARAVQQVGFDPRHGARQRHCSQSG